MRKILFGIILCFFSTNSFAQSQVQLVLRDSISHAPLAGVVVVDDGGNALVTDSLGEVTVPVHGAAERVQLQLMGYVKKEILLTGSDAVRRMEVLLASDEREFEEVQIVSTRTNSRLEDIPNHVEVLGVEELDEENGIKPAGIASILGDIAGIQIQTESATTGNASPRIQGLDGRYSQILRDGIPIYGGFSGSLGILQIPPIDLRQIEIIKGSCSTLYGGGAIGGIINLISKEPSTEGERGITLNQTSSAESDANIYLSKMGKKWGYTFLAGGTLGFARDVDGDGLSDISGVQTTIVHPAIFFEPSKKFKVNLQFERISDARRGGDMTDINRVVADDTLFHVRQTELRQTTILHAEWTLSKVLSLSVKAAYSDLLHHIKSPVVNREMSQQSWYNEAALLLHHPKTDWVFGVNFNGDQLSIDSVALDKQLGYSHTIGGVFAQQTWKPVESFTTESGLRADISGAHTFLLPRLAVLYSFNKQWSLRCNGGLGYTQPEAVQLANQETELNDIDQRRTPDPEHSAGFTADLNYKRNVHNWSLSASTGVFYTEVTNPVIRNYGDFGTISFVNADRSLISQGFQTYLRAKHHEMEFFLTYIFTDVQQRYSPNNQRAPIIARHQLSNAVTCDINEHWMAGIEGTWLIGIRNEENKAEPGYYLLAASVHYKVKAWTIVFNAENLLNIRQSNYEKTYSGDRTFPIYKTAWAPLDGRVLNLSARVVF